MLRSLPKHPGAWVILFKPHLDLLHVIEALNWVSVKDKEARLVALFQVADLSSRENCRRCRFAPQLGEGEVIEHLKGKFEYNGSLQTAPGSFEAQHAEGTVEIYWKAPDKVAQVLSGRPLAVRRGYDGKDAWGFHPQAGVRSISPAEITEIIRDGALYQPIALSNYYAQLSYDSRRRVDGPEVDIVDATTKDNRIERFYFDSLTGLPVRLDLWEEGPEATRTGGEYYLAQFYLGDYRIVNGIQVRSQYAECAHIRP